jgi:hypothetical protein
MSSSLVDRLQFAPCAHSEAHADGAIIRVDRHDSGLSFRRLEKPRSRGRTFTFLVGLM